MKKIKKSEISSQVFAYMIAVVILSVTIIFGFKMVNYFKQTTELSGLNDFKMDFGNTAREMSNEWGSLEKRKFTLSSKITHVCVGNSFEVDDTGKITTSDVDIGQIESKVVISNKLLEELIKDSITNKVLDNVFLIDKTKIVDSFFVENIKIWKPGEDLPKNLPANNLYFKCFENNNGVRLVFYASGKNVRIAEDID